MAQPTWLRHLGNSALVGRIYQAFHPFVTQEFCSLRLMVLALIKSVFFINFYAQSVLIMKPRGMILIRNDQN